MWRIAVALVLVSAAFGQDKPVVVEGIVVDAISKAPLENVAVAVRYTKSPDGSGVISALNMQGAVALTDAGGRFRIEESKTVPFRLYCVLEGYVDKTDSRVHELKAGQRAAGVTIALEAEAQISGRVVDEESGAPVAGMVVGVFRYGLLPVKSGKTDGEGRYTIKGLPVGEYEMAASPAERPQAAPWKKRAPDKGRAGYQRTWYPGVLDAGAALAVQVPPGGRLDGYDFKLRKLPVLAIRGVVEAEGMADRVSFTLSQTNAGRQSHMSAGILERAGAFEIADVPPGDYRLQVSSLPEGGKGRRHASAAVHLSDKAVEDLRLTLLPGVRVTGEVRLYGGKDGEGSPWRDERETRMKVGLLPNQRAPFMSDVPQPLPADSRFAIESVSMEPWSVSATGLPPGHVVRAVMYNGLPVVPGSFELNAGAMAHHLTVLIGPVSNSLTGRVTRKDQAVEKAIVVGVLESELAEGRIPTFIRGETDASGHYSVGAIVPGVYKLTALTDMMQTFTLRTRLAASDSKRVEIGESSNEALDFKLP